MKYLGILSITILSFLFACADAPTSVVESKSVTKDNILGKWRIYQEREVRIDTVDGIETVRTDGTHPRDSYIWVIGNTSVSTYEEGTPGNSTESYTLSGDTIKAGENLTSSPLQVNPRWYTTLRFEGSDLVAVYHEVGSETIGAAVTKYYYEEHYYMRAYSGTVPPVGW